MLQDMEMAKGHGKESSLVLKSSSPRFLESSLVWLRTYSFHLYTLSDTYVHLYTLCDTGILDHVKDGG